MKEITCIICPNGCRLVVDKRDGEWLVSGNMCPRGKNFGIAEMINPKRSICSTVRTVYKDIPRLPIKTDGEIPLDKIFPVMNELKGVVVDHPVHRGDSIIEDVLKTGVNIVATLDMYYIMGEEF